MVFRLENCLFPCPSVDQIISLGTFGVQNIYTLNISTINLSGILFLEYFTLKLFFEIAFSWQPSSPLNLILNLYLILI